MSRGRRLAAPVADAVRPTSDRVRESIFDILGSMIHLEAMKVADLFAGTGALGIEALSRGAGSVTFVERDPDAAKSIPVNLASTGLESPDAVVVRRDVLDFLRALPTADKLRGGEPGGEQPGGEQPDEEQHDGEPSFDLVFCDPPYSFDLWDELIPLLPADLCVLESGSELTVPDSWMVLRSRRYGSTLVTVVRAMDRSQGRSPGRSPESSTESSPGRSHGAGG
jgi:16S rRNA (guanine966-N2)-methyltransferase